MRIISVIAGLLMFASGHNISAQTIDVKGSSTPIQHYWSEGTCAGRANEGLRASWLEQLKLVKEHCGFKYLRMHGLFDDDMFVYFEKPNGKAVYNWQYIDEVYDRMLVKTSFHAYRMLHQLGDEKLYYSDPLFVSRSWDTGKVTAVAFNYPKEYEIAVPSLKNFGNYMNASSKNLDMSLTGLKPGATFIVETLDKDHGNVYDEYVKIGAPHSPSRQDIAYLKQKAWETKKETLRADENGNLALNRELAPWTCILIKEL